VDRAHQSRSARAHNRYLKLLPVSVHNAVRHVSAAD
jgi:hypothetical protein